jgi:hypothetical protein
MGLSVKHPRSLGASSILSLDRQNSALVRVNPELSWRNEDPVPADLLFANQVTALLRIGATAASGQTRSPRAAPRNPSGVSGNPQITDSLVAGPKSVGQCQQETLAPQQKRPSQEMTQHLPDFIVL